MKIWKGSVMDMDQVDNEKTYTFQIKIDYLSYKYERPNSPNCIPTVYIVGDVIAEDGRAIKCDVILPGMQQRFEMIIAELYLNGFDGYDMDSHLKAITILYDEMKAAHDMESQKRRECGILVMSNNTQV